MKKNLITLSLDEETIRDVEACIEQVNRMGGDFLSTPIDPDDTIIIEPAEENFKPLTS